MVEKELELLFRGTQQTKTAFYVFKNTDGSLRWLIPVTNPHPTFLIFYNSSGLKAKLLKSTIKILYRFRIKHFILNKKAFYLAADSIIHKNMKLLEADSFSIFTGTAGPNRKFLIEFNTKGKTNAILKIGFTDSSLSLIQNERAALKRLNATRFNSFEAPQLLNAGDTYVTLSMCRPKPFKNSTQLTHQHYNYFTEFYKHFAHKGQLNFLPIVENIRNIQNNYQTNQKLNSKLIESIGNKLSELLERVDQNMVVFTSLAHNDFTPWNMYLSPIKLYVYDWELSKPDIPLLHDLFHFIFQSEILIGKSKYEVIKMKLATSIKNKTIKALVEEFEIDVNYNYTIYLLYTVSYYTNLYINQNEPHIQVNWLLNTWNDALEDVLKTKTLF